MSTDKKEEMKKPAPKAEGFVVAEGRAVVGINQIFGEGEAVTAESFHGGAASLARLVEKGLVRGAA